MVLFCLYFVAETKFVLLGKDRSLALSPSFVASFKDDAVLEKMQKRGAGGGNASSFERSENTWAAD